jgi:hypothetical protein
MDAFETLVALLLRREGYWTATSLKVELTKEDKCAISRPSSPRWELDVVAYRGATNEVLAVECKSFLDSPGVIFRNGTFEPERRYKLFTDARLRDLVLDRLACQLIERKATRARPKVTLALATGKIATRSDRDQLVKHFKAQGWRLLDDRWIRESLRTAADALYENDVAYVVSRILMRNLHQPARPGVDQRARRRLHGNVPLNAP